MIWGPRSCKHFKKILQYISKMRINGQKSSGVPRDCTTILSMLSFERETYYKGTGNPFLTFRWEGNKFWAGDSQTG